MSTQIDSLPSTWFATDPINKLLDSWFAPVSPSVSSRWPSFARTPAVDVSEDDKRVTVRAEIPGIGEKDVDISHEDGVLYLKGEKKGEEEKKEKGSYYKESWSGSFSRAISLGNNLDWNKVDATFKDGVLTVTLPKISGTDHRKKISIH